MEAMLGLEKAGQEAAAVPGYRSALNRSPQLRGHDGMGNSYFAMGNLKETRKPHSAMPTEAYPEGRGGLNNLGHVLLSRAAGRNPHRRPARGFPKRAPPERIPENPPRDPGDGTVSPQVLINKRSPGVMIHVSIFRFRRNRSTPRSRNGGKQPPPS